MADAPNNSVVIYANQQSYKVIEKALEQLDRPKLQVAIDTTIAEVTLNDTLSYGVQFFLKSINLAGKLDRRLGQHIVGRDVLGRICRASIFCSAIITPHVILNALHQSPTSRCSPIHRSSSSTTRSRR